MIYAFIQCKNRAKIFSLKIWLIISNRYEVFGFDTDKTSGLINERNEVIVGQITHKILHILHGTLILIDGTNR